MSSPNPSGTLSAFVLIFVVIVIDPRRAVVILPVASTI
jgi:hypothetical protein